MLALWGSQFVFRVGETCAENSGSRWDPGWDPRQKACETQGKPMVFRSQRAKTKENIGFCSKSSQNHPRKTKVLHQKLAKPWENHGFCAENVRNLRKTQGFLPKLLAIRGSYLISIWIAEGVPAPWPRGPGCGPVAPAVVSRPEKFLSPRGPSSGCRVKMHRFCSQALGSQFPNFPIRQFANFPISQSIHFLGRRRNNCSERVQKPKENICFCAKSLRNSRKTNGFPQKACERVLFPKLTKSKENTCFCANSLQNLRKATVLRKKLAELRKPLFVCRKIAKPEENHDFCAESLAKLMENQIFCAKSLQNLKNVL